MSPPQAAMASFTAASNSSAPFSLGCERGCITLFRVDWRWLMFFFCSPKVKPASRQPDWAGIEESEGTISLTVVFPPGEEGRHRPHHEREGWAPRMCAVPGRRSTGQPRGRAQYGSSLGTITLGAGINRGDLHDSSTALVSRTASHRQKHDWVRADRDSIVFAAWSRRHPVRTGT